MGIELVEWQLPGPDDSFDLFPNVADLPAQRVESGVAEDDIASVVTTAGKRVVP